MSYWSQRYFYYHFDPRKRLGGMTIESLSMKYKTYRRVEMALFVSNILLGALIYINYDHMKKLKIDNPHVKNICRRYMALSTISNS